MKIMKTRW
jgi:hypothetical protein